MKIKNAAAVVLAMASLLSAGAAHAAAAQPDCYAVAHHENAAHTGYSCTSLPAAPTPKWTATVSGFASYPLIVGGRVFVVTNGSTGGGRLYALRSDTGAVAWGPIPISGTYGWYSIAYNYDKVFVNNFDGTVTAFAASTGKQLWSHLTEYFSGELVAWHGVVYVHGAHAVYALSESTGAPVWTSPGLDGDGSSVSVNAAGVYVAAGCSRYRLAYGSGTIAWSGNDGCGGGGGGTTYLSSGRVFATVGDMILNQTSGRSYGSFAGTPAFAGQNGFFAEGDTLFAENVTTLVPLFSASVPGTIVTSPVVAGNVVYVGVTETSSNEILGLSTSDGSIVWRHALPAAPGGGGQYSSPESDIAVGDHLLIVPVGNKLLAFG